MQTFRDLIARPVTWLLAHADLLLLALVMLGGGLPLIDVLEPHLGRLGSLAAALPAMYLVGLAVTELTTRALPGRRRPFVEAAGDLACRVALWAGWELIELDEDEDTWTPKDGGC